MPLTLQSLEEISEAPTSDSFRKQLTRIAEELQFAWVMALLVTEVPGGEPVIRRIGNAPPAFAQASLDPSASERDPVWRRLKRAAVPFLYDQAFYVREHAGDLWEEQAAFGYKVGANVALHLPGGRHFLLGLDRDQPLPGRDTDRLQLLAHLHLLAAHAQPAALRLLGEVPRGQGTPVLSCREQQVLRASMACSTKEVASRLCVSAETVKFHLKSIRAKLRVGTTREAILKALDLKLL